MDDSWFMSMKETSSCPLFTKGGTHLSRYGSHLAIDTFSKYVANKLDLGMSPLKFTKINFEDKAKEEERDLEDSLNLYTTLKQDKLCYPNFTLSKFINKKPKMLMISDSFYWSLFNNHFGDEVFAFGGFWYYNNLIYPDSYQVKKK